ncbi:MAG: tRNA (adenosine(37)-N6)-threonylcarbamoyltransferase complex dimerization subunit type 1 TsaB [bacterium]|nr:tRNA (adenosine(37)-N6)-threonylcarbamoyltransferase complex dimerization subunit type 1 TsaB [bacterium]
MLTLALDTATRWGRFAVADADGVLAWRPLNVGGSYADALLPAIEAVLAEAGCRSDRLEAVAVTAGPGSFTGIRIGVATAKTLAWALGCRLYGVSTLAAMAASLLADNPTAELAVPVLDARRGEVFAAAYRRGEIWGTALAAPAAASPDHWWSRLIEITGDPDAVVYGGEGAGLLLGQGAALRPELRERGIPRLRAWTSAHPATARELALVVARGELEPVDPFRLVPAYLRASDAELNRNLDCTPVIPDPEPGDHRSRRDPA